MSDYEIVYTIKSFANYSASGPDGMRPQHVKDLIGPGAGIKCKLQLLALASLLS